MKTRIVILFALTAVFTPLVAQELKPMIIPAGGENITGGTYCFGDVDTKKVNALWHVVGPEWQEALAAPENFELTLDLNGKPREFVRKGVVYYAVAPRECLYIPSPIRARVDIIADLPPENPTIRITGFNTPKPASPWYKDWQNIPMIGTLVVLIVLMTLMIKDSRKLRIEKLDRQIRENAEAERREWDRNHPAEAGPPVVEGGVNAVPQQDRYTAIVGELSQVAATSFPGTVPSEWRVVGDIVRGHLVNCDGMVRYRTGTEPAMRHFTNEPAFEALMEHIPTGERHRKYVLWACLNGCWLNMVDGMLNFVPDTSRAGNPVVLSPIVLAEQTDIARYGEPSRNVVREMEEMAEEIVETRLRPSMVRRDREPR